jgi:dethiobiotin synthetase
LTRTATFLDLFERWRLPVVLCARTSLGTINHSLLAISALRARGIAILGIAFIGDANEDSEMTIARMGGVTRLGRLPYVAPLTAVSLREAFRTHFRIADFRAEAP